MKIYITAILLIFALFTAAANGQENAGSETSHTVRWFLESCRLKEELLIPKVQKGEINNLGYAFEKLSSHFFSVNINIGCGRLKSELETEKVTWKGQINLDHSMGFEIFGTGKLQYFLGYDLRYLWILMEYPVWDESRAYWSTSLTIGPYNRFILNLNNGKKWISTLDAGLLGLVSRPDEIRLYAQEEWTFSNIVKITNSDFRFGSINSLFVMNFVTEYRIPLNRVQFFSVFYSFLYSETVKDQEPPLYLISNNFGLKLGF